MPCGLYKCIYNSQMSSAGTSALRSTPLGGQGSKEAIMQCKCTGMGFGVH